MVGYLYIIYIIGRSKFLHLPNGEMGGISPPHLQRFIIPGMSVLDFMPLKQFLGRTFKAW